MVHCSLHPSGDSILEDAGGDAWVHDDDGDVDDAWAYSLGEDLILLR